MKTLFLSVIPLMMVTSTVAGAGGNDIEAIKETARLYMEAWYGGDAELMKRAVHRHLSKRSLLDSHHGKDDIRLTTGADMVAYTRSGYGKSLWRKNLKIEVVVLDFHQNIASVKVITPHYYEYLHLVKLDGKWTIINALYEKAISNEGSKLSD